METVTTVADARAQLSSILRTFREDPSTPSVTIGAHRRPEAVIVPFSRYRGLSYTSAAPPRMLDELTRKSTLIERLARLNRLTDVAVFGSVARGSETDDSDIDLLVTPLDGATLFDLAQFELDMAQLLGREVQVVSRRALDPRRDAEILEQARPVSPVQ